MSQEMTSWDGSRVLPEICPICEKHAVGTTCGVTINWAGVEPTRDVCSVVCAQLVLNQMHYYGPTYDPGFMARSGIHRDPDA